MAPAAEELWCGGLKALAVRMPVDADRARGETIAKRWRRWAIVMALSIPIWLVLFVAVVFAADWLMKRVPSANGVVGWSCIGVVAVGGILAILFTADSRNYFWRARTIRTELATGRIVLCDGPSILAERALWPFVGGQPQLTIEVLVNSGVLWTASGKPVSKWVVLKRARTAPAVVQQPVGNIRRLSSEELAELRRHVPIRMTIVLTAIIFNLAAVAMIAVSTVVHARGSDLFLTFLAILLAINYDWRLLIRKRLQRDAASGVVVVARKDKARAEVLPNSRRLWTVNGLPAGWRRTGSRLFSASA